MRTQTYTFYNPKTNHIVTGRAIRPNSDYICLGYKKVAEAFTSVLANERPQLWKSYTSKTVYSFDFELLNSKLRHKLTRLGIKEWSYSRGHNKSEGERLLDEINAKSK